MSGGLHLGEIWICGPPSELQAGSSWGVFEAFGLGEARYLTCERWEGVQR